MGDIATIGNTYIDFGLDIEMVAGKILEILVEQGTVQESNDATVFSDNLCTLIGDGIHFATYAVTFYPVAYSQSSGHERDAIEEVFHEVLHGEADTSGKTGSYYGDTTLRHLQHNEG